MDRWQTYAFEFKGGLITNLSPLQQGVAVPGSARILKNFEPSVEGGYRRINGYAKYSTNHVQPYGNGRVHGAGQTGTTLVITNLTTSPSAGDTLTIEGVTGTYTIATGGALYDSATTRTTLTLTTPLASSPANLAIITFGNQSNALIRGVLAWNDKVVAVRNGGVWSSTGTTWSYISAPKYGTPLVNGAGQSGTTLNIDGLTIRPVEGDTFSIGGVDLTYTVLAATALSSGATSLTISPALATSPADNAVITFLGTKFNSDTAKVRFTKYRLGGIERIAGVDGVNTPFVYKDTGEFYKLTSAPSDILAAKHIAWFKNQLVFGKDDKLTITSPYSDDDFNPATGAVVIATGSRITALIVFREQLIVFGETTIQRLVGNTSADFALQPIADNIGCVSEDTVQEIGGDIMFLAADGLRLLGATDRIGDFSIGVVSKTIQGETNSLVNTSNSFASMVVRNKSQYRIFGYNALTTRENARGLIAAQVEDGMGSPFSWSETQGIKAYVCSDDYYTRGETNVFAFNTGYVYRMESGNSFDGTMITAVFATPYVYINDPSIRKTFYRLKTYVDVDGSLTSTVNLKFDFDDQGSIQPDTINISNASATVSFFNSTARFGSSSFGGKLRKLYETQTVGSGFFISLLYISEGLDPPYSFDAATLEYATHDRR